MLIFLFNHGNAANWPETGRFAYEGGPQLAVGAWVSTLPDSEPQICVIYNNQIVSQRLKPDGSAVTLFLNMTSYECINNETARIITNGYSYPSGDALQTCLVVKSNITHYFIAAMPGPAGKDAKCPTEDDMQEEFIINDLNPSVMQAQIFKRVEGFLYVQKFSIE